MFFLSFFSVVKPAETLATSTSSASRSYIPSHKYLLQIMLFYSVSFFEIINFFQDSFFLFSTWLTDFSSNEKHVLGRMFHLDKLHHLRLISEIFQYQGTYRVGNHNSLTFHEDAVTRYCINNFRLLHLLTNLLVTTRSAYYQLRSRLYAFNDSIVSGSIASMQSDKDI